MESKPERMVEVPKEALEELMSGMWDGLTEEQQENLYLNASMKARTVLRDILPNEQREVLERINRKPRYERIGPVHYIQIP